jgi:ABC-type glycerol-3-phosphate transport system substrate-binding protein
MSVFMTGSVCALSACGGGGVEDNKVMDYYQISIACQSEESEQDVMKELIAAYEKKNPNVKISLESFTGKDFEVFMNQVSQDESSSPNIIWTSDTYHARWEQYFTDLRPFYERDASTDYSLYYASMLDTASINGRFKPTKNYKGSFRSDDLDTSDGLEDYRNHSQYGLYFAPRDYNKPAILCNTALFEMLDTQYEEYYKAKEGVTEMPADYLSATARLNDIVAGNNWDDLTDLFAFSKSAAEKIQYVLEYAGTLGAKGQKVVKQWQYKTVLDLKLNWEPSYTTILNAMGVENIINTDGTLNLEGSVTALEQLHTWMYSEDNLYYADDDDLNFKNGETFMRVVSRPVVLSYGNNLKKIHADYYEKYNRLPMQTIRIPAEEIAGGCSGYAINSVYEGKGITVDGVYKSYAELCWDFLKFIITEEGQEVAGATGSNIPVLKSLREDGAWRHVPGLEDMDQDAWLAGEELKQEWFNVYKANYRVKFRDTVQTFFRGFQKKDFNGGSLAELIKRTNEAYNAAKPTENLR